MSGGIDIAASIRSGDLHIMVTTPDQAWREAEEYAANTAIEFFQWAHGSRFPASRVALQYEGRNAWMDSGLTRHDHTFAARDARPGCITLGLDYDRIFAGFADYMVWQADVTFENGKTEELCDHISQDDLEPNVVMCMAETLTQIVSAIAFQAEGEWRNYTRAFPMTNGAFGRVLGMALTGTDPMLPDFPKLAAIINTAAPVMLEGHLSADEHLTVTYID